MSKSMDDAKIIYTLRPLHSTMCGYNCSPAFFKYNSDSDVVVLKYGGVRLWVISWMCVLHVQVAAHWCFPESGKARLALV